MKSKKALIPIIIVFIVGLLIFLYPTISNTWNKYRDQQLISDYDNAVAQQDDSVLEEELQKAEDYNKTLVGERVPYSFAKRDGVKDEYYESLLNINGNGMIGYIEIPAIDVNLPIYHYTTDEVLQKGAGHIFGSSLPVGGKGTHSVISAHRGLPSAKMFTDINLLEEGDDFQIHVLNRTVTYEVDQIKTVEPEDTSDLEIEEGRDYVTLLTCTPYGVNTQRLLVRGHRIANPAEGVDAGESSKAPAGHNPGWPEVILSIIAGLILGGLIVIIVLRINRRKS
ncbi:MAG: class C sortase [Anaerovoracaceae bacterium]|jgi:sortase A